MEANAVVTIKVDGDVPVAVYPNGMETRVELHPGDKATFDTSHLVVEPAFLIARSNETGV